MANKTTRGTRRWLRRARRLGEDLSEVIEAWRPVGRVAYRVIAIIGGAHLAPSLIAVVRHLLERLGS